VICHPPFLAHGKRRVSVFGPFRRHGRCAAWHILSTLYHEGRRRQGAEDDSAMQTTFSSSGKCYRSKENKMSKDKRDFFKKKKLWSVVKDELLRCYLVPYFSKIIKTRKPLLYIDCFAGQGKFDDGKDGSPLTALHCLDECLAKAQIQDVSAPPIMMQFIELNHASALQNNIPTEHLCRCTVTNGAFETNIIDILSSVGRQYGVLNVFLYVDPYGIKALDAGLFLKLPTVFKTAELLINLNSVGFIREALRVRKIALRESEADILSELDEYDRSEIQSISELNTIAGGNYWQEIVDDYKRGTMDFYKAERTFADRYKHMLRQSYHYVLDLPIRLKSGQNPKYRLVHATNHPDGCVIMADNVFKRTDYLVVDIQNKGQLSMFKVNAENEYVDEETIDQKMLSLLQNTIGSFERLNKIQASFFDRYGVICSSSHLSSSREGSSLKRLEKIGLIEVRRTPSLKSNKPTAFWTESKDQTVEVRKK
jgi:three-Cys-motif partner protein